MRILRIVISVLTIALIALNVMLYVTNRSNDVAPTIECSADVISVTCGADDSELLKHVSAHDEQDGDITSSVVVERKSYFVSENKSKVIFAAIDSDHNVTTLEKDVIYTDYVSPKIEILTDLIFQVRSSYEFEKYIRVTDLIDGDISSRAKLISSEFNISVPGTYKVNVKATNSMGDVSDITVNAIVTDDVYEGNLALSKYIVYAKVGDEAPDYASLLKNGNAIIDSSAVDMTKAGVYDVFYKRMNGNTVRDMTRLIVKVEE